MKIIKVITLLFISFSLLFGNIANAAMLCCVAKNQPAAQVQMDSKAEMPCHKSAEKTDKKMQHEKSCVNCKNCLSSNVIIFNQPVHHIAFANIIHSVALNNFVSVAPESIYSPPKQIS
jgi:hypothetical protein